MKAANATFEPHPAETDGCRPKAPSPATPIGNSSRLALPRNRGLLHTPDSEAYSHRKVPQPGRWERAGRPDSYEREKSPTSVAHFDDPIPRLRSCRDGKKPEQ